MITFQYASNVLITNCTTKKGFCANKELNWLVHGFSSSTQRVPRIRFGTISHVTRKPYTNLYIIQPNILFKYVLPCYRIQRRKDQRRLFRIRNTLKCASFGLELSFFIYQLLVCHTRLQHDKRLLLKYVPHFWPDWIKNLEHHMRISGTEPSSEILSQTK